MTATLVYFSTVPWNSFSQRPHYFVRWYHARFGGKIVWVEPYPCRFPKVSDFNRLKNRFRAYQPEPPTWLKILRTHLLPIEPIKSLAWINRFLWRVQLLNQGYDFLLRPREHGLRLAIGKPSDIALQTLQLQPQAFCLYDCMDEIAEFHEGRAKRRLNEVEQELIPKMKTVWASSSVLFQKMQALHHNVVFVPNGFDESMILSGFQGSRNPTSDPVAGYVGAMGSWFDWDWLQKMAYQKPEYRFELIGPVSSFVPSGLPNNVVLLGPLAHHEAMARMRAFKIALIPFKRTLLTHGVDPIKFYEYKALGLPIISTSFGEMLFHRSSAGVFLCDDLNTINGTFALAENYVASPLDTENFLRKNSWPCRFDEVAGSIHAGD